MMNDELKVAMVEAGRPQSDNNFTEHTPAFELKYRNPIHQAGDPELARVLARARLMPGSYEAMPSGAKL